MRSLGWPVYDADHAAKSLYSRDPSLLQEVVDAFGREVLNDRGALNRAKLAQRVFGSPEDLERLNGMVHPRVRQDFEHWAKQPERMGLPWVVREAAILLESGAHVDCDALAVVEAPKALRLARVQQRSGWTLNQAEERMKRQWPAERLRGHADFLLVNDGVTPLVPQVLAMCSALNAFE